MSKCVLTCEEESHECDVLVHVNGSVKWDILVQEGLAQVGDRVSTHGHQETGVCEHHATGGATSHGDAISGYLSETGVLSFNRVVCG